MGNEKKGVRKRRSGEDTFQHIEIAIISTFLNRIMPKISKARPTSSVLLEQMNDFWPMKWIG